MCWNSAPRTRCSAGARAGSRVAGGPLAAAGCVRAISSGGSTRAARTLERVRRVDRSAVAPAAPERSAAGCAGAVTGPPAAGCVSLHAQRWDRAGRPDLRRVAGRPADDQDNRARARPAGSRTASCGRRRLCRSATPTPTPGRSTGGPTSTSSPTGSPRSQPPPERDHPARTGSAPQLKLEMQYVLQCRHDERPRQDSPRRWSCAWCGRSPPPDVASLLDQDRGQTGGPRIGRRSTTLLLRGACSIYAYRSDRRPGRAPAVGGRVRRAMSGSMRRLGFDGNQHAATSTGIPQPWLRDLAKRWLRWRLGAGLGLEAGGGRRSSRSDPLRRGSSPAHRRHRARPDRPGGAGALPGRPARRAAPARQRHGDHIGLLNWFLARGPPTPLGRQRCPPTAMFFTEDYPKRDERPPRALAEQVMAQLEHPDNLARFANPAYRLVTLILMRCRAARHRRAAAARRLRRPRRRRRPLPALYQPQDETRGAGPDRRGAPRPDRRASHRIAQRWPAARPVLFPRPTKNPDGTHPIASSDLPDRAATAGWPRCDIRDEHGRPVHLTPHQWRHTLGHPADQPRRPARGRAAHPRPRLPADDRALRPAARHHRPPALGSRPQGRHPPAQTVTSTPPARSPRPPGPSSASAGPPRRCPTATAGCRSRRPARTPTPA